MKRTLLTLVVILGLAVGVAYLYSANQTLRSRVAALETQLDEITATAAARQAAARAATDAPSAPPASGPAAAAPSIAPAPSTPAATAVAAPAPATTSAAAPAAAFTPGLRLEARPGSSMKIEGTSTIHDWTTLGRIIAGSLEFDAAFKLDAANPPAPGPVPARAEIVIPVRSLKSQSSVGASKMDEIMLEAMHGNVNRTIAYSLREFTLKTAPKGGPWAWDARGLLTINAVTTTNEFPVTMEFQDDGKIAFRGKTQVKMTTYSIAPPAPTIAGGAITTGDEVTLTFEWITQPAAAR